MSTENNNKSILDALTQEVSKASTSYQQDETNDTENDDILIVLTCGQFTMPVSEIENLVKNYDGLIESLQSITNVNQSLFYAYGDNTEDFKSFVKNTIDKLKTYLNNLQMLVDYEALCPEMDELTLLRTILWDAQVATSEIIKYCDLYRVIIEQTRINIDLKNRIKEYMNFIPPSSSEIECYQVYFDETEGGITVSECTPTDDYAPDEIDVIDQSPEGTYSVKVMASSKTSASKQAMALMNANANIEDDYLLTSDLSGLVEE